MQTSYNILMGVGIAGEFYDTRNHVVESAVCESATIGFGLGVVKGTDERMVALPTSTGNTFKGVAMQRHKEQGYPFAAPSANYTQNDIVGYMTQGAAFVQASKAVAADAAAYLIVSGDDAGKFTDSNSGTLATGGYFKNTITEAGIVGLELNRP